MQGSCTEASRLWVASLQTRRPAHDFWDAQDAEESEAQPAAAHSTSETFEVLLHSIPTL